MTPAKKHRSPDDLTAGQRWLSGVSAFLMICLAALAFRGMFSSVRDLMIPFLGHLAWIVPIGTDLGIMIMVLLGVLFEWLSMPMPALRIVAGTFMGVTMWLNAAAARGAVTGIVGHLALPLLFIASVEAARHFVRRRSGLAMGTVREGVPLARWLLAPLSTFMLWRRMALWQVTSYRVALDREQLRRRTIARLRARHGSRWRSGADSAVVWQLVHGIDVEGAAASLDTRRAAPPPDTPAERQPARQPARRRDATERATAHARARRLMASRPDLTLAQVAARTGLSERTLSRIRNEPPSLSAVPSNPGA